MATITVSKKLFEKEIGKLTEEMKTKIAMLGLTVEKETQDELLLEVFPNRPDMLSYHGFKRAFLSFLGKSPGIKKYRVHKPEKGYKVTIDSSVRNIRPYTVCAIIKGLKLDSEKIREIIEIQEKLHSTLGRRRKKLAIGIYPLDKIKLPITFKAMEPDKIRFIPLGSQREMSGLEILQKHPTGKEYAHLLAGKIKFPVFIDGNKNVLSMPPIINSQLTGKVEEDTREVFIECSGFDLEIQKKCLNILVTTLAEMGGKIYQMEIKGIKEQTPDLSTEKMKISLKNVNKLLGLNLSERRMAILLERMGYNYKRGKVEIPPWRTDIMHEVDLIEDIAIAYGYENFNPEIPKISTIGERDVKEKLKSRFAEILVGLNLLEVSNYHLTRKQDQITKMELSKKEQDELVEVEDSKTDYTLLRKDLSHYILKNFSENIDEEYPQRIFEIGKVFKISGEKILEKDHLCVGISPGNFTEIKQILEYIADSLGLELKYSEPEDAPQYFVEGRVARIELIREQRSKNRKSEKIRSAKLIGFAGEIHPRILKNWKIKMPVALLEISLEEVYKKFC